MADAKMLKKVPVREQDPKVRAKNFEEVCLGYNQEEAMEEAQRCLGCKKPKCVEGCPVSINIPGFIEQIKEGKIEEAYKVIGLSSALPAICGRVCPQESQCEGKCIRGVKGEAVSIGKLERFVADYALEHDIKPVGAEVKNGHKVAVIGSGPSGLTCAGDLAKAGYDVTVFEALHELGGVLVYGIPEFRLPKQKVVKKEIEKVKELGVKFETNVVIGKSTTIDQLIEDEGFEAVFIGSGAGLPMFMGIPGENASGVFSANEYLTRNNLMSAYREDYDTPIQQPDFMTYYRGIAGGGTPNCLFTVKKAGQLTVTGTIYQNNKVFRTISKTFTVKSENENTNGTTPKPQQPAQPASVQKGTKVTDKKSKAVYKVNGNKTVEYNKVNKKAKKATVPSTITVNGVKYQVTSIAAKAFANNKKLTKVVIPASVRSIGKQAFSGCKNLKSITIKTTYLTKKSVGAKAFKGIHAKATIKVPKKQKKAYQKFLKPKGIGKGVKIK